MTLDDAGQTDILIHGAQGPKKDKASVEYMGEAAPRRATCDPAIKDDELMEMGRPKLLRFRVSISREIANDATFDAANEISKSIPALVFLDELNDRVVRAVGH